MPAPKPVAKKPAAKKPAAKVRKQRGGGDELVAHTERDDRFDDLDDMMAKAAEGEFGMRIIYKNGVPQAVQYSHIVGDKQDGLTMEADGVKLINFFLSEPVFPIPGEYTQGVKRSASFVVISRDGKYVVNNEITLEPYAGLPFTGVVGRIGLGR
jgi:hypothetical protein